MDGTGQSVSALPRGTPGFGAECGRGVFLRVWTRAELYDPQLGGPTPWLVAEGQLLRAGDFHHAEGGSDHGELHTDEGVEVMLVGAASDYLPALR